MPADDAYSAGPGASLASQPAGGVIYDRGYRRYDGVRLGRLQIALALFWHSLRSSFGIGRGAKAKILPVIAFAALCLPAVVNAVAVAKGGPPVVFYGTSRHPSLSRGICVVTSCRCIFPGRCAGGTIQPRSTRRSPWPAYS
jgi:hypothetical protein